VPISRLTVWGIILWAILLYIKLCILCTLPIPVLIGSSSFSAPSFPSHLLSPTSDLFSNSLSLQALNKFTNPHIYPPVLPLPWHIPALASKLKLKILQYFTSERSKWSQASFQSHWWPSSNFPHQFLHWSSLLLFEIRLGSIFGVVVVLFISGQGTNISIQEKGDEEARAFAMLAAFGQF